MEDFQQFQTELTAARRGRFFVREQLPELSGPFLERIELVVSELVTNAVVHASGGELRVKRTGSAIRVEVSDKNPVLPTLLAVQSFAEHGRGLRIVDTLASRWGAEASPGGKAVWCELEETGSSPAWPDC